MTFDGNTSAQFIVCALGRTVSCFSLHVHTERSRSHPHHSVLSLLRYGCPPEALLGRLIWVPFYNLAFIRVQQQIGDGSAAHETTGLIAGSLIASCVAYPFFMFKFVSHSSSSCYHVLHSFTLLFFCSHSTRTLLRCMSESMCIHMLMCLCVFVLT